MNELKISLRGLSIVSAVVLIAALSTASFVLGIVDVTAEVQPSEILDSPVRDKSVTNSLSDLSLTQTFE